MSIQVKGTILTLVAGIAWGISGVSGQYLMAAGVPILWLTSIRLFVSGICLLGIAFCVSRQQLKILFRDKKALGQLLFFALFGLLLNQFSYLQAIHHTNAGTATVLQYVCPVIVLVYACLRQRRWPSKGEVTSIFLAIAGTVLIATHGNLTSLAVTPIGLFWGLFSALTYTLYIVLPVGLIKKYGSLPTIGVGMLMGGILLGLLDRSWTYHPSLTTDNLIALFGIVMIGTVFAYTFFLQGVSIVGEVKGSLLAAIEPVSSVFFGILLLGEVFYPVDFLGMLSILLAVLLISLKDLFNQRKLSQKKLPSHEGGQESRNRKG
ncbi:DMT family transporter [Streptococcus sp. DD13]|uniref:DMT family transporter n=1 Tax=Streptococcus sp. DD13 TaxID=1777881 RepID=UPI00079414FE|nr:DMT family transporter [Streptococcus sp. DD13]KXT78097.1 Drug/metabolite transporter (DMT) superfamily protein [Streptococcus sp. DD13]